MSDEIFPADDRVAEFKRAIEAVILVAQDPVAPEILAQLLEQPVGLIERWCDDLAREYNDDQRGFELARVAGGYRYQTHADQTPYVERFVLHDQKARLSGAALETLAIIAYKQPISRAQVASIRGVDPDGVIRTLQARGYIGEAGRDDGPGQAVLFGTTEAFLEKLGLDSLDDLPPIAEFIPGADVVETLEQGLRVDPVDVSTPPVSDSDGSTDYEPATEQPDQASANGDRGLGEGDATAASEVGETTDQEHRHADQTGNDDFDAGVEGATNDSQPDHIELADPETGWTRSAPDDDTDSDANDDEFAFDDPGNDPDALDADQHHDAPDSGDPVDDWTFEDDDVIVNENSTGDDDGWLNGSSGLSSDTFIETDPGTRSGTQTDSEDDRGMVEADLGRGPDDNPDDPIAPDGAEPSTFEHQPDEHDGDAD